MLRKVHRRAISYFAVAAILAGLVLLPNEVLCVAQGGHLAIEVVSGGMCSEASGAGMRTGHNQPDGCPTNCRDTQITSQAHPDDASPLILAPLAFASILPPIETFSTDGTFADQARLAFRAPPRELQTTVLRC